MSTAQSYILFTAYSTDFCVGRELEFHQNYFQSYNGLLISSNEISSSHKWILSSDVREGKNEIKLN